MKSHAVKKMTRKGLVETNSREGIVKETAEAKSDGRRINEADFQLERKGAQSRAEPVDDKPVADAAARRKKQMVQKGVRNGNGQKTWGNFVNHRPEAIVHPED